MACGVLFPWSSLLGKGILNLGYMQIVRFVLANNISFSEAESLCPQGETILSEKAYSNSNKALVAMERSRRYQYSISPYLGSGMIYLVRGEPEQARQILQDGLMLDEDNLRAHTLLGCAYLQSGEKDAAIAQWQNIQNFGEWRVRRGHILRLEGNWEASNRDYLAVVQVSPSSYLYHLIGFNYAKLGQISDAISAYKSAIELGQSEEDHYVPEMSRLELAKLYIAQEDWPDAKTELEAAITGRPAMSEAYEQLGVVYFKGFNDLQRANELLLQSIRLDPDAAKSYLYLGSFNRARKEYAFAEKWLNVGVSLPSNMWTPWLHGELGRVYLELGRYAEAIPELKAVIDAVPTNSWYLELLGDAYYEGGDLEMARQYYSRVIDLDHANTRVQEKLKNIQE